MQRALMTNRIEHLLTETKGNEKVLEPQTLPGNAPTVKPEEALDVGEPEEEEEEEEEEDEADLDDDSPKSKGFGGGSDDGDGLGYDDHDDEDDDEDEDDLDEEALERKNIKDKLRIAKDGTSGLTDGRVIFVRDPNNEDKVYMIAAIENIIPEEQVNIDGGQMWMADVIVRLKGRGYTDPKQSIRKVNPEIFKKDNWEGRTEGAPNL